MPADSEYELCNVDSNAGQQQIYTAYDFLFLKICILFYIWIVYLRRVPLNNGWRISSGKRTAVSETMLQSTNLYSLYIIFIHHSSFIGLYIY
jgi:hypothetical protein